MWALAAALSSQFNHLRDSLYQEATKMLGQTQMHSVQYGTDTSQLELAQAWILISIYELTQVTFQRAWSSAGRAIRLVQLMRLGALDAEPVGADDFVVLEEQRRTFWTAFCLDRLTCIMEKLPLTLSEQPICTRLPCPEQAFQSGSPVVMPFLSQALESAGPNLLFSPFVESILFTALWGRVFVHQQLCAAELVHGALSDEFCDRQLRLDDLLSRRMAQFEHTYPYTTVEVDQMLLFTSIIGQMTVMALCKAAELALQDAARYGDIVLQGYQWRAPTAAKDISRLIDYLDGFSLFNVGSIIKLVNTSLVILTRIGRIRFTLSHLCLYI